MRRRQRLKEVKAMKRIFEEPTIEIIAFNVVDVITASQPGGIELGEDELPISPFDGLFNVGV